MQERMTQKEEGNKASLEFVESGKLTELIARKDYTKEEYIKTGFDTIDRIIGGFLLGELSVIAGRPAMGKTGLMLSMAVKISEKTTVLYVNLEKSLNETVKRITECNLKNIDTTSLSSELYLMCMPGNIDTLIGSINSHIELYETQIIFIDYIQLISEFNKTTSNVIIEQLKRLAIDNNIAIVLASQLYASVEDEDFLPSIDDLRDFNSTELIDKNMIIYRPEYYNILVDDLGKSTKGNADIIVSKNRNGRDGIATICYKGIANNLFDCIKNLNKYI